MAVELRLPEELLSEILNRVPVKTVVRCTSVCKSWYSFITSPRFIKTRSLSDIAEKQVYLWCRGKSGCDKFYIHKDNNTFDRISDFDSRFHNKVTRVVSSCNGLVCICVKQHRASNVNVFLWNPSIRRVLLVDPPRKSGWETIGFGFTPATNEFKVVDISSMEPGRSAVLELGSCSWKNLYKYKDLLSKYKIPADSPQCILNDTIHWVGCKLNTKSPLIILTFNMRYNKFRVLHLPSGVNDKRSSSHVRAIVYQDSLALVQIHTGYHKDCCIWVMNKYGLYGSWTKHVQFTIAHPDFDKLLGFDRNGDLLLSVGNWCKYKLVSYDPKCERYKALVPDSDNHIIYADDYVQSLVLLEKQ